MKPYQAEINARPPSATWLDALFARWYRSRHHPGKTRSLRLAHAFARKPAVIAPVGSGLAMELDPADYVQREILFHGTYEARTLELMDRLLGSSDEFWDFGAHVGLYTLRAAQRLAPRGQRVVAIEPNPAQSQALQRNLLLNRLHNVTLCTAACGEAHALSRLITPDADNTGGSRLGIYERPDSRRTRLMVPVMPAAFIARELGLHEASLVKIDAEGCEFAILDSLLTQARPAQIIVEYFPSNHRREEVVPRYENYRRLGYRLKTIEGEIWDERSELPENNLWLSLARD